MFYNDINNINTLICQYIIVNGIILYVSCQGLSGLQVFLLPIKNSI